MKKCFSGILLAFLVILIVSCVSTGAATESLGKTTPKTKELDRKEYAGAAEKEGDTFLNARNAAVMDAVRKAVIDIIGAEQEEANREILDQFLYNTRDPNAYIYNETLEATRREIVSEDNWRYELTVDVNLTAVRSTLKANGLIGSDKAAAAAEPEGSGKSSSGKGKGEDADKTGVGSPDYGEATEEERTFIARYIDRMTYMVFFREDSETEDIYKLAAVNKANEYLASQAMDSIDFEQIARLKEDQQTVYEEETGESISIIQWIAQKLDADIYIEISGRTKGTTKDNKYYGEANIDLKAYEASTAFLSGSASYNTMDKAFSQTSEESACLNAIQGAVYTRMPYLIDLVKKQMVKTLVRGIRYEVTIQNPLGDRAMSRFWSKLEKEVKAIDSVSQSSDEVKYYVWYIGSVDDLKNLIYDVTETVAGLENLDMVMTRGKSITFNTGN
jgi:hypothetical protein